jgi:hypothetical protein
MFMQLHREKIASKSLAFFAIRAAWHGANALKIPSNISFLQLPPWRKRLPLPLYHVINNARRGPRSSSIKRALRTQQPKKHWPVVRDNGPSIHVSKSADRIVDQCCEAGTLAETKSKSKSCPSRAAIGQVTAARVASEHHSRVKRA